MITLQKMTAEYVGHEDRIALIGDAGDDGIVRLWLIRPLAHKLATSLANLLMQQASEQRHAEALEAFKQALAEEQHIPTHYVSYGAIGQTSTRSRGDAAAALRVEQRNEWLIREINAKLFPQGVTLTFKGSVEGHVARCGLSEDLLRQWLGILRKVCHAGGWIGPDWPSWMSTPMAMEGQG